MQPRPPYLVPLAIPSHQALKRQLWVPGVNRISLCSRIPLDSKAPFPCPRDPGNTRHPSLQQRDRFKTMDSQAKDYLLVFLESGMEQLEPPSPDLPSGQISSLVLNLLLGGLTWILTPVTSRLISVLNRLEHLPPVVNGQDYRTQAINRVEHSFPAVRKVGPHPPPTSSLEPPSGKAHQILASSSSLLLVPLRSALSNNRTFCFSWQEESPSLMRSSTAPSS